MGPFGACAPALGRGSPVWIGDALEAVVLGLRREQRLELAGGLLVVAALISDHVAQVDEGVEGEVLVVEAQAETAFVLTSHRRGQLDGGSVEGPESTIAT